MMDMGRIVTVAIPGKAWLSQAFGSDPHYKFDEDSKDIEEIVRLAEVKRVGAGARVVIHGEPPGMEHLYRWFAADGGVWLADGDDSAKADGRACLEAARRIRVELDRK
jgi:hypothetical protein